MGKINFEKLPSLLMRSQTVLEGFEAEFFKRIWNTDLNVYRARLNAIRFSDHKKVLDVGFGNGQWAICLSEMNEIVYGIEYSETKLKAVDQIKEGLSINNLILSKGQAESLQFEDNQFDAVFCYCVIYLTDFKKSLSEFYRVLKPDGKLYFTIQGLGWYLMNIIEEPNKSEFYNPRKNAIDAIDHSLGYFVNDTFEKGKQLYLTKPLLEKILKNLHFENIIIKSEGDIKFNNEKRNLSFYKHSKYLDKDFIYDVYCVK